MPIYAWNYVIFSYCMIYPNIVFLIFTEFKLILLNKIKPIKYKRDNIAMDEANGIMWWEEFRTNSKNIFLDKNAEIPAEAIGLKIQFEISKTMQDTWSSLIKYKIVLRIVVIKSANKYALNP